VSAYCTAANVQAYYGTQSVAVWADLNANKVAAEIDARIALAIETASDEINDHLRGGPYAVPFADAPDTPPAIRRACVWLAGYDLYNARGATDTDQEGESVHRLSGDRKRALRLLGQINAGVVQLDETPVCPTTVPQVIHTETDAESEATVIGDDERENWS
jgi:phage gp36-like protein